jgi:hypothetical protein
MATSSRQSTLFGVQDWKRLYQTYRTANFQSYDYETLRKTFIDYLTQYYPETFNDYIESSEFVALLDVIAYLGQALAFRDDLNARENFIDTAERRDSVVKLANLVSYTPKRNTAGQGLVKVTAVSTTENITDLNGIQLSNQTILWNDPANSSWQEQFNTILNATLVNAQRIGRPGNSQNILGITTSEYTINIPAGQLPVIPYSAQINSIQMNFELVSATSANEDYLYELPPAPSSIFNILYRNDKLGYASPNTGFFFYFKQGTLQNFDFNFNERIENNLQLIDIDGINNTDTWMYQLTPDGVIEDRWTQVQNIFINTNLQGTSTNKIFAVTSRANDQVTYIFGDGVFGEVPVGAYRAYIRSGNALTYTIDPSEMNGITVTLPYVSRSNRTELLTFTFSLQQVSNTALQRETITQIKQRAPARYYTQNRMVNGEDYTNFPFTLYNSIIKSAALNRSSIGVSRNQDLLDPTGKYSSTNVFANDGALYTITADKNTTFSTTSINFGTQFISLALPVLLQEQAAIQYYQKYYPRYSGLYTEAGTVDGKVYWQQTTLESSSPTGYFYIINTSQIKVPVPLGTYSTTTLRYVAKGAQLKFVAPVGSYFNSNGRLQQGVPNYNNGDSTYIWIGVTNVVGDGFNFGTGNLSTGSGPVTLNSYVPTGAYIDITTGTWTPSTLAGATGIIPQFDNTLGTVLVQQMLTLITLNQDFALAYNNGLLNTQERWSIVQPIPTTPTPTDYFVTFINSSIDNNYLVSIRNTGYYFASVDEVRFLFDGVQRVFDAKSGRTLTDTTTIYSNNNNYSNTGTLGKNYPLSIIGQQIQSDGYPDDYQVTISNINPTTGFTNDPDFFYNIVGNNSEDIPLINGTPIVFFKILTDINDLYRTQVLPQGTIINNNSITSRAQVAAVIYEYEAGTIFYCQNGTGTGGAKFYQSALVSGSNPPVLTINDVTSSYVAIRGRSDLNFQYQHNSDNTTRIDPGTTNIIDLFLVTQAYYTQYQNWLRDTTGTVPLPPKPTINELQQAYGDLDSYKMISDSVVLNSVDFKPLFGTKAVPALQGTIKVIKSQATTVSDSQIRSAVLSAMNTYFTIDNWNFGDTFYMSELTAYLHVQLGALISSVVLVSANPNQTFGDLYEVLSGPSEIFVNGATENDIIVISALTPAALQR